MADTDVIMVANPGHLLPRAPPKYHEEDRVHQQNLKKGFARLDRRSLNTNKGAVKKHGHGGKYTIDGPYHDQDYAGHVPAAMDENDPNYIDPSEEDQDYHTSTQLSRDHKPEVAAIHVVEPAPKVETTDPPAS